MSGINESSAKAKVLEHSDVEGSHKQRVTRRSMGYRTVPEFFPRARQVRRAVEAHFGLPFQRGTAKQVWNYWHVPGMYTYLRTSAHKVIPQALVDDLVRSISEWARQELGTQTVTSPLLSVYVNGCRQSLHHDVGNGEWGYVFSLTHWDSRKFEGGETLLVRRAYAAGDDGLPVPSPEVADRIPATFNQLLVFDDWISHGVEPVQGSMNPLEGRIVLHGHLG